MSSNSDKHSQNNYRKIIAPQFGARHFYLVEESSLMFEGNFEILVMEDEFCALIIHVSSSCEDILASVPIGILITAKEVIDAA